MAYAINIRSDSGSAAAIRELWQRACALEDTPSMERLDYPPHLTLAIYDVLDIDRTRATLSEVFESLGVQLVRFSSLGIFETHDSLVVWARPANADEIVEAHHRLHESIGAGQSYSSYQPGHWVPHCSIATAVPLTRRAEALEFIRRGLDPVEVQFDVADLVSFHPVEVLFEKPLSAAVHP